MTAITLSAARLWHKHPRELIALGTVVASVTLAAAGVAWSSPGLDGFSRTGAAVAVPALPPLLVRNVAPEQALDLNQKIPLASGPNPAAQPFSTAGLSATARGRALDCLASAAYYEAGNESDDGIRAVAQVVLNRVRHPAFPSSVCGVVYQGSTRSTGCQFTFTCDGSLMRQPNAASWTRARRIAEAALGGFVYAPVGWATHYHANYVLPYWAPTLAKNALIGAHLFYRWSGGWGRPGGFTQRYARQEPDSMALRATSLAAFASRPETRATATGEKVEEIPGAEVAKAEPGRVAVRFNLSQFNLAREAAEKAPRQPYVEKVAASDNLRWSLSDEAKSSEVPLGRSTAAADSASRAPN
ncbi:MAG: cell wall hydrolase [Pseudomonadota bacterium]|nr:cell wall hydrolase [Pseudomonadota bacterium]